jgi:hypothetical protein
MSAARKLGLVAIAAAAASAETFPKVAAVAGGCGCGGGGCNNCKPPSFPPGYIPGGDKSGNPPSMPPGTAVPIAPGQGLPAVGYGTQVAFATVAPSNGAPDTCGPPIPPYWDMVRDAMYMTIVAGEATIAGGATTEVVIQPTQGWFDGFYVEIYAVDAANPQTRQRVRVGRFFVGDCPGDCRTISIFSDVFEANQACCNGRPLRARFSRAADGNDLRVEITNPNAAGNVIAQVLVRGYCNRMSCGC